MKFHALVATAAASMLLAGAANAAVVDIDSVAGNAVPAGFNLITDFNPDGVGGIVVASGFTFTNVGDAYIRDGGLGLDSGQSAPPPLNNLVPGAWYETVEASSGSKGTLTSADGLWGFSFYMGSPDFYNHVKFTFTGANGVQTLDGAAIWGGSPPGNGDQSFGTTVIYRFDSRVTKIEFTSDQNSFEFDRLAGTTVPEPGTWAMMIMGFGAVGSVMRRRRTAVTA